MFSPFEIAGLISHEGGYMSSNAGPYSEVGLSEIRSFDVTESDYHPMDNAPHSSCFGRCWKKMACKGVALVGGLTLAGAYLTATGGMMLSSAQEEDTNSAKLTGGLVLGCGVLVLSGVLCIVATAVKSCACRVRPEFRNQVILQQPMPSVAVRLDVATSPRSKHNPIGL